MATPGRTAEGDRPEPASVRFTPASADRQVLVVVSAGALAGLAGAVEADVTRWTSFLERPAERLTGRLVTVLFGPREEDFDPRATPVVQSVRNWVAGGGFLVAFIPRRGLRASRRPTSTEPLLKAPTRSRSRMRNLLASVLDRRIVEPGWRGEPYPDHPPGSQMASVAAMGWVFDRECFTLDLGNMDAWRVVRAHETAPTFDQPRDRPAAIRIDQTGDLTTRAGWTFEAGQVHVECADDFTVADAVAHARLLRQQIVGPLPLSEQVPDAVNRTTPDGHKKRRAPHDLSFARAVAVLKEHPEWSLEEIAAHIGVHRTTIYKPTWRPFFDLWKQTHYRSRSDVPGGMSFDDGGIDASDGYRSSGRSRRHRRQHDDSGD